MTGKEALKWLEKIEPNRILTTHDEIDQFHEFKNLIKDTFREYSVEEIQEARDVLKEMRHNCIPHESDLYDDPKREIKLKALDIALKYIPS